MVSAAEHSAERAWDIAMRDLSAGYGRRTVIDGLTARFPAGAVSVLLGESGCGKTTVLRVLLGLMKPSAGALDVGGRDVFALPDKEFRRLRRNFGVLFQDGALLGSLTVAENVALPLAEHTGLGASAIRRAVTDTLDLVGLGHAADLYPGELSGGMKKRAGLARAIILEPPVLFCDEPTSGLDPIISSRMNRLILDMHAFYPDMTTVLITHDMESVRTVADHVLLLKDGRCGFNGPAADFLASDDPYIREFVSGKASETGQMRTPHADPAVRSALDEWLGRS